MNSNSLSSVAQLSNTELVARVKHLSAREREAIASLIAHLAELDRRRLYFAEGCSSMFTYCTQVLHLSEHAAYGRIEAARAARRFPVLLERLCEGSVNLTTVGLLATHLTSENHLHLLDTARHKSRRQVEELVARLRPQPAVPGSVRKLPTASPIPAAPTAVPDAAASSQPAGDARDVASPDVSPPATAPPPARPAVVAPLAPQRYKVQFTASVETYEKIRLAQNLLRCQRSCNNPQVGSPRIPHPPILERRVMMMTSDERLPEQSTLGEDGMIGRDRWEEMHRLAARHVTVAEIARRLDVDRKTVARCLRQEAWQPYQRAAPAATLLAPHVPFLHERAAAVGFSARILWQELRAHHGYAGSYETVKRFVRPLREEGLRAALTWTRFETPPGEQSQIDWGQARVMLGHRSVVRHLFVLTLGFSRRSFYAPCLGETLSELLDAHERAFEYFGGHTREHLYDRPRTVCRPTESGVIWNTTFRAFADFWGFEPRLCRPYRAQTKGKVESGIKYFRRNFLPGRTFRDDVDLSEQLGEWMATVADVRVHGTTHERPIDRFTREQETLITATPPRRFQLEAKQPRIVAGDYLISFETNRYSVPFRLIGQSVEVHRQGAVLAIFHHGDVVARHQMLTGQHQLAILPEHGPGVLARIARQRRSTLPGHGRPLSTPPEVDHRDLACYDAVCQPGGEA